MVNMQSEYAKYVIFRERKSYLLPRQTRTKHRETDTGNKEMVVNYYKNMLKQIYESN